MFADIKLTHINTACAIMCIDGVNFLTDPIFCPAHTTYNIGTTDFETNVDSALTLAQLPVIDAVLLSHEDHPDNLDEEGRKLLDGRKVFTTPDGCKKLAPRPGVTGLTPWQAVEVQIGGKEWKITSTPCIHLPGGEVTGFILETESFGRDDKGRPNAIWISGDTIWHEELLQVGQKWNIFLATLNLGNAQAPVGVDGANVAITMDGQQAAQTINALNIKLTVPLHFEGWTHFTQYGPELRTAFTFSGVPDERLCWLEPGVEKQVYVAV